VTKHLKEANFKEKKFIWLVVSDHGHLACLPLGLWQDSTPWQKQAAEKSTYLMVTRKQSAPGHWWLTSVILSTQEADQEASPDK
jgi:hypothetical protein